MGWGPRGGDHRGEGQGLRRAWQDAGRQRDKEGGKETENGEVGGPREQDILDASEENVPRKTERRGARGSDPWG